MTDILQNYLNGVELPKVKTDVEVNPSTSLILLIGGVLLAIWAMFSKRK